VSNAIAITSIVASAVVGLSVALLTLWADSRRQRRQGRAERLSELREVLDLGGAATAAALYAFDRRKVSTNEADRKTTGENFNNKVETVLQLETRIAIRLGENDAVSQTYKLTLECLEELRALIFDAGAEMTSQQNARADELRSQVVALRSDYLRHSRSRATDPES
jgi:hypothetical protein